MASPSEDGVAEAAAKEAPPAISGLGLNVHAEVLAAYMKVRQSDPDHRQVAVDALRAAVQANPAASSCLALSKAFVLRANNALKHKTKGFKEDMARDEDVVANLKEAVAVAIEGADNHGSLPCSILAVRLLAMCADTPYTTSFDEALHRLILRSTGVESSTPDAATPLTDADVIKALQTASVASLQRVDQGINDIAADIIVGLRAFGLLQRRRQAAEDPEAINLVSDDEAPEEGSAAAPAAAEDPEVINLVSDDEAPEEGGAGPAVDFGSDDELF